MPLFIVERNFAEQLEVNEDVAKAVVHANVDANVNWVFSFLSADKKKTYCLYEAVSAEAIREAAVKVGLPADVIIEVDGQINPNGSVTSIPT
ncbi:MAG: DUF4242 domain-containing protein [SAR202 cluster bacterium]|jgi:hypothetical protein|nr:DUF4242 domain-containing protein [SAR202 cluster bacterium]